MDTYFDALVKRYERLYRRVTNDGFDWNQRFIEAAQFCAVLSSILILHIFPWVWIGKDHPDLINIPGWLSTGVLLLGIFWVLSFLAWMFFLWRDSKITFRSPGSTTSPETIKAWVDSHKRGCEIKKTYNVYRVLAKELHDGQGQTEIGRITFARQNTPPFFVSLRGKNRPTGASSCTQDFRLLEEPDNVPIASKFTPCISRKQFEAISTTITLQHLRIRLFPQWTDGKKLRHWTFTVRNTGIQDELQRALEELNRTVIHCLAAETMENAIETKTIIQSPYVFQKEDLIRVLNGGTTSRHYAEAIEDLVEKVERLATVNDVDLPAHTISDTNITASERPEENPCDSAPA